LKKLKVLQVGCGGISDAWLGSYSKRDDIEIVGVVDLIIERAKNKKIKYNLECDVYEDFEKAIDITSPDIVIDNTTPEVHHKIVTTSLDKGCNVFGEKPLADTMENAIEMVQKANDTKKFYFVMQNRRFLKDISSFKEIIKENKIGKLGYLDASFYLGPHFGGFRDVMDSPLVLDMAIHTFDQARFITNCDPVSVYCHEFNPAGSWYKGDANAVCIFEMTDNVVFTYNGSWCAVANQTSWESEWRAMGSEGGAVWDGKNPPWYEINNVNTNTECLSETIKITPEYKWGKKEGHSGCIEHLFIAFKEKVPAQTDCNDNIKSLAMVMAAIKSSKEQRKVYINELI